MIGRNGSKYREGALIVGGAGRLSPETGDLAWLSDPSGTEHIGIIVRESGRALLWRRCTPEGSLIRPSPLRLIREGQIYYLEKPDS